MWALQEVQICKDKDPNSLIREHYDKNLLKLRENVLIFKTSNKQSIAYQNKALVYLQVLNG